MPGIAVKGKQVHRSGGGQHRNNAIVAVSAVRLHQGCISGGPGGNPFSRNSWWVQSEV